MKVPWSPLAAEFVGTALLVGVGLSVVILDFGHGSPVPALLPDPALRRALTGLLFGTTGALIAVSPLGKASGAHINPVVTLAFRVRGRIGDGHAAGYVLAQLAGAIAGALPLRLWGGIGDSIAYGATVPGSGDAAWQAMLGEAGATFALVILLLLFLGHRRLRRFTPLLFPPLYAFLVWLEAPLSGTSTNPARSLGPAVISGRWDAWWIYWVGPVAGALLGVAVRRWLRSRWLEDEVAKLYHFKHDPHRLFSGLRERAEGTEPV